MKLIFRVFVLCCLFYRIALCVKPGKIPIRPKEIISLDVDPVKYDPDVNYLKRGSTKKITCRGSQRYQKIEWYDPDGDEIARDSNQRVFVQDSIAPSLKSKAQALVLVFKEAFVEDSGIWECRSGELLQKVPLCIIDPLVFVDTPTEVTVDEGRAITLTCQARGDPEPKIVWYRNGEVISETDEKLYISTKYNQQGFEGLLTIKSLTAEDGGTYVCEAVQEISEVDNCVHSEATNITLNVNQRPKFDEVTAQSTHKYVFAVDDEEVQLVCNPSAYPKPKFRWFKETRDVWSEFPEKQFKVSDDGTQSILSITAGSSNYDQKFRCMANNQFGSAVMVFELKKLVRPSRVTEYSVSNATDTKIWFNVTGIQDCEPCDLSGFEIQYFVKKTAGSPKEIQWKRSHIKNWVINDIEDSVIMLDELKPDTEYWVRVRPYNSLGRGPWSLPLLVSTTSDMDYEDYKELAPEKELLQATTDFGMFYGFLLTGIIVVFGAACIFLVQKV